VPQLLLIVYNRRMQLHEIRADYDERSTTDMTPLVKKLAALLQSGHADKAKDLLPRERVYPVPDAIARRLGMNK
jgi:hypothetical protein